MTKQDMQFEDVPSPNPAPEEPAPEPKPTEAKPQRLFDIPAPARGGAPVWANLPPNFKFPRGKTLMFLKFRADWTDTPLKGDPIIDQNGDVVTETKHVNGEEVTTPILWRQCVVWPLNVGDKKLALGRGMGDVYRTQEELARQMIRVADGEAVDWSGAGSFDIWWEDLGEKCRGLLIRIYNRLHVMDVEATTDFLQNCVEVRTSGS